MKKNRKKRRKYKGGNTYITKSGGGAGKMLLLYAILGGAGYAAWYYRDKLGIKLPWAKSKITGAPGSVLAELQNEASTLKGLMNDAQNAGDNQTYISVQKRLKIVNLQIESELEL